MQGEARRAPLAFFLHLFSARRTPGGATKRGKYKK